MQKLKGAKVSLQQKQKIDVTPLQQPTNTTSSPVNAIVSSTPVPAVPNVPNPAVETTFGPVPAQKIALGGPYTFRVRRQLPYMTRATTVTASNYKELLQKIRGVFGFPEDAELRIVDLRGYAELKGSQNQHQHQHVSANVPAQQPQASQQPPASSPQPVPTSQSPNVTPVNPIINEV